MKLSLIITISLLLSACNNSYTHYTEQERNELKLHHNKIMKQSRICDSRDVSERIECFSDANIDEFKVMK